MNRKKLMYSIIKEVEKGNNPKKEDYQLSDEHWGEIAQLIKDEELLKNVFILYADDIAYVVSFENAKVTMKGLDFLEGNSVLGKSYSAVKELFAWIK